MITKVLINPKKGYYLIKGKIKSDKVICDAKIILDTKNKEEIIPLPVSIGGNINFIVKVRKNTKLLKIEIPLTQNSKVIKDLSIKKISLLRSLFKFYRRSLPLVFPHKDVTKRLKNFVKLSFLEIIFHPERSYYKVSEGRSLRICAENNYEKWIKIYQEKEKEYLKKINKNKVQNRNISFLIVILWGGINVDALKRTIQSLNKQFYSNYRIAVSKNDEVKKIIKDSIEDYVIFIRAGDIFSQSALFCFWKRIKEKNYPDLLYGDNDFIEQKGKRVDPMFKPDWSPEYFFEYDYIKSPVCFKKSLLPDIKSFTSNYELILEILKKKNVKIEHIPAILLTQVKSKENNNLKLNALKDFFENKAEVTKGIVPETFRVKFKIEKSPKVSIIIPTKNKLELIKTCIESIHQNTSYKDYEIILIDNGSTDKNVLEFYQELEKNKHVKIICANIPFNFSKLINLGVKNSTGEIICLLNNDTKVINHGWLTEMVSHALRNEVGVVGAKLLYPDGTVQHGGVILGIWNGADHAFKGVPNENNGYMFRLVTLQNYIAVTAACMVFRREIFENVEGFDESFSVNFNDVDFCLKVYEKGYRIVWTPHAVLYHFESKTRGVNTEIAGKEIAKIRKKWKKYIDRDPYYNPNLTIYKRDFSITGEINFYCDE